MQAVNEKREEQFELLHMQAWLNRKIEAKQKKGKGVEYIYKKYDDFYKPPNQKVKKFRRKTDPALMQLIREANEKGGN